MDHLRDRAVNPFDDMGEVDEEIFGGFEEEEAAQPEVQIVEVARLQRDEKGNIPAQNFTITRAGLVMHEGATFEDWLEVGETIFHIDSTRQWVIGDWLRYGEKNFQQSIDAIAAALRRKPKTLQNWAWVCSIYPFSRRRENTLTFSHLAVVAKRTEEEQEMLLDLAEANKWSEKELRAQMQRHLRKNRLPPPRPMGDKAMKAFDRSLEQFTVKVKSLWSGVGLSQRQQWAVKLRTLADEIERNW